MSRPKVEMDSAAPSFRGRSPRSAHASAAARGSSAKTGTAAEMLLRRALWARGLRYRVDASWVLGRPDIVFESARVAVFCDGDFWHGHDLDARLARLERGHNAAYWTAKINRNVARDALVTAALEREGWAVLRVWESDIRRDADAAADAVEHAVRNAAARRE